MCSTLAPTEPQSDRQWSMENMNFVDHEPTWQAFDQAPSGPLQEPSDYTFRTPSQSPQMAAGYKLEPCDTLSPDYLPTPVALEGELDISFVDSESLPWPTSYTQDFDVPSVSSEPNEQDVAKGMRKEVSPNSTAPCNLIVAVRIRLSDNHTETSRSKQKGAEGFPRAQRQGHPKTGGRSCETQSHQPKPRYRQ